MARDTREKMLDAALEVFARDGYAGTNIKDIAEAVGIVKSAFYRHFESKEDIWNAVLERTSAYYRERFGSADGLTAIPRTTDELYAMTVRMVNFTVHDDTVVKMRRILTTEQFRNGHLGDLATRYFLKDTKAIFEKVFASMMEEGTIRKTDPGFLAFSYTAPITALIHLSDREPERKEEAISQIEAFIKQFLEIYGAGNEKRVKL